VRGTYTFTFNFFNRETVTTPPKPKLLGLQPAKVVAGTRGAIHMYPLPGFPVPGADRCFHPFLMEIMAQLQNI